MRWISRICAALTADAPLARRCGNPPGSNLTDMQARTRDWTYRTGRDACNPPPWTDRTRVYAPVVTSGTASFAGPGERSRDTRRDPPTRVEVASDGRQLRSDSSDHIVEDRVDEVFVEYPPVAERLQVILEAPQFDATPAGCIGERDCPEVRLACHRADA